MYIKNNYTIALIDIIYDNLSKEYEALEKIVFEAQDIYEQTNDDRIKYFLEKNIAVAKNHLNIMIEIISNNSDGKLKDSYIERLNARLDELKEIERKIISFQK